jgi:quercetin dioxygenase-like cupin family protein
MTPIVALRATARRPPSPAPSVPDVEPVAHGGRITAQSTPGGRSGHLDTHRELCEAPHFQYHVSGTLRIRTGDGTEFDAVPGQVTSLPAGHDAWVVGDEPVVVVDWYGASSYAR